MELAQRALQKVTMKVEAVRQGRSMQRNGTSTASLAEGHYEGALQKVTMKVEELRHQVKISTKTKTEIKSITRELAHAVGILTKKMNDLALKHNSLISSEAQSKKPRDVKGDVENDAKAGVATREISTQTNEQDIQRTTAQLAENIANTIESH
ncbi:hypothetical protein QE152_g41163, partial [Popillia japonica]